MRFSLMIWCLLITPRFVSPAFANEHVRPSTLQLIYDAEDHRLSSAPIFKRLDDLKRLSDLTAALTALGRIGDPKSTLQLTPFLTHRHPTIRSAAASALGWIGGPEAVSALTKAAAREVKAPVLGTILTALGRAGDLTELDTISTNLAGLKRDPLALAEALEGIGLLLNKNSAGWPLPPSLLTLLAERAGDAGQTGIAAAFALTRYKGDIKNMPLQTIILSFNASKGSARALLARVLGKTKAVLALDALLTVSSDTDSIGVRVETARALANFPDEARALDAVKNFLVDEHAGVQVQALQSIASMGAKASSLEGVVQKRFSENSVFVKSQALQTLAVIAPNAARPSALELLKDKNPDLISAGLNALGVLGAPADLSVVISYIDQSSTKLAGSAISAVGAAPKACVSETVLAPLRRALARHDLGLTAAVADAAASLELRTLAPDLATAYNSLKADDVEAKLGILGALGKIGSKDQLSTVEFALNDDERLVVAAAAAAYKTLTNNDVSARIPATSTVRSTLPQLSEIGRASRSVVLLRTTRGSIRVALLNDAPLVAYHFVSLVESGFYDGLTFHRVVPNFVAQGGDPRGDGFGGPGYLIRDQVSAKHHLRGTLGMATAGKDTAGSQFFINLAPNLHLDGAYSVFAYVVAGMDTADQLEGGDQIIEARLFRNFDEN